MIISKGLFLDMEVRWIFRNRKYLLLDVLWGMVFLLFLFFHFLLLLLRDNMETGWREKEKRQRGCDTDNACMQSGQ